MHCDMTNRLGLQHAWRAREGPDRPSLPVTAGSGLVGFAGPMVQ